MREKHEMHNIIKDVFGFDGFKANQEAIVNSILAGKDVVAVMPTGGGKSLCYQLPARIMKGLVVVISPLIALMKDQVDAAKANGLRAEFVNSSQTREERTAVKNDIRSGALELLYIAPEQLNMDWFASVLKGVRVSLFAIDEAHCISEWGHDFRPEYLRLGQLRELFPDAQIAAFTATATAKAQSDIIAKLAVRKPSIVRASFNRPNLFYDVRRKEKIDEQLLEYTRERAGLPGIIYRTTRNDVENTAKFLRKHGVRAVPYHAGLDAETRARHQDMFQEDEADVVVATIAFGMGIDKANVRFVAHADIPKNIESYYQETGRAGRDGAPSRCTLFYSDADAVKIRFLLKNIENDTFREIAYKKLESVMRFSTGNACRRKQLLAYFDEAFHEDNCGACDYCASTRVEKDVTADAKLLLAAIIQTGQRYGATYLSDIMTGKISDQRVVDNGHDNIPAFGSGSHMKKAYWSSLARKLTDSNFLERGEYSSLSLTEETAKRLESDDSVFTVETVVETQKPTKSDATKDNPELFERLRKIRREIALERKTAPYIIFYDSSLWQMCAKLPTTKEQFLEINGVGARKMESFGQSFLDAIKNYVAETKPPAEKPAPKNHAEPQAGKKPETAPAPEKAAPQRDVPPNAFWTKEKKNEMLRLAESLPVKKLGILFDRPVREILKIIFHSLPPE